jgi:hypothetical protein
MKVGKFKVKFRKDQSIDIDLDVSQMYTRHITKHKFVYFINLDVDEIHQMEFIIKEAKRRLLININQENLIKEVT